MTRAPFDPASLRGRDLAAFLIDFLVEVEQAIATRRRAAERERQERARRQVEPIGRTVPQMMLSRKEAALALGVSLGKAQALITSGELPSVKIGGLRRVRVDDLRAYVEGLQPEPGREE